MRLENGIEHLPLLLM